MLGVCYLYVRCMLGVKVWKTIINTWKRDVYIKTMLGVRTFSAVIHFCLYQSTACIGKQGGHASKNHPNWRRTKLHVEVVLNTGISRLQCIFRLSSKYSRNYFKFWPVLGFNSKIICIFAVGSGRNLDWRSISYYFALNQNAQETVWK